MSEIMPTATTVLLLLQLSVFNMPPQRQLPPVYTPPYFSAVLSTIAIIKWIFP